MKIIETAISLDELKSMAQRGFGEMVKAVVDVEREIIAVDGELHADEEALLLENGSRQENLWGINLYPELKGPEWVEFDSIINIRPSQGNRSRNVEDPIVRTNILKAVEKLVNR